MEACVGAHHLSRRLKALGHDARLVPARYVRPYSKGQKNDFRDAEAIAEAVQRPTMKFVATKTAEQLDLQALHRVRERLVSQRTGIINQIRAFLLERGVAVRQGLRFLRTEMPRILAAPLMSYRPAWGGSSRTWLATGAGSTSGSRAYRPRSRLLRARMPVRAADERARHRPDHFQRDGGRDRYRRCVLEGRDFAAWLGLVPRQISTGDRTILGKISKRGNRYLRVLFVQAAWVVLIKPKSRERHGLKPWIEAAKKRLHRNVLAIALANKLVRIAWSVLARGRDFEVRKVDEAAAQPA